MLKIGDFSRIGHVSVETLRNYDEIGLLRAYQTVTEIKFPVEKNLIQISIKHKTRILVVPQSLLVCHS